MLFMDLPRDMEERSPNCGKQTPHVPTEREKSLHLQLQGFAAHGCRTPAVPLFVLGEKKVCERNIQQQEKKEILEKKGK